MKKIDTIFNTLKKVTLTAEERTLLQSRIAEYQAYTPLPEPVHTSRPSPFSLFSFSRPLPVFASFAIFLLVGGGVAQAAEGAVPGDILYPIKTAVNEEVRVALAVNAETKAEAEAWRAERRLEEAQTLAVRSALSLDKKEQLAEHFSEHAARVEQRIAAISERDPALATELATKFEASLSAHEAVLASLDTSVKNTRTINEKVRARLATIGEVRRVAVLHATGDDAKGEAAAGVASFSATLSVEEPEAATHPNSEATSRTEKSVATGDSKKEVMQTRNAERLGRSAEKALKEARKELDKKRDSLSPEEKARIQIQIENTQAVYDEGGRALHEGRTRDAFTAYQKVILTSKTLTTLLDIDFDPNQDRVRVIEVNPIDPLPPEPTLMQEGNPTIIEIKTEHDDSIKIELGLPDFDSTSQ